MINKKILIGIQPTGNIHIGNYLGCIKEGIKLQETNNVIFLIAGLHSLTSGIGYVEMMLKEEEMQKELVKLGCKNIHRQSENHIVCNDMFEYMCITPFSELKKMTQFKEKGSGNLGLFSYPMLQVADILFYEPDYVLAGEDQSQHIELARKIARKVNKKIPDILMTKHKRIMSLSDPSKKMSKSLGDKHCLYLFKDVEKNVIKAVTTKEGIDNLKNIANGIGIRYSSNNKKFKERIINKIKSLTI